MIDMTYLCKTTGWHNNCGLNCLTHFLIAKIVDGSAEQLFRSDKEYISLLQTFKQYYYLDGNLTIETLKQIIQAYPAATDREAIFGPVLRKQLEKVLSASAQVLWETDASAAISEYLNTGEINDVSEPLFNANRSFLTNLKHDFDARLFSITDTRILPKEKEEAIERLRQNKLLTEADYTPERIKALVDLIRKTSIEDDLQNEAHAQWMSVGCKNYAEYVGNLQNGVMVSAEHLSLLCQSLKIGLEVYTPASIAHANSSPQTMALTRGMQNVPDPSINYRWMMKVHNEGIHWEYEEPNRNLNATTAHNNDYSINLSKAKFEIRGLEDISDEVMAHLMGQIDDLGNMQSQPPPIKSVTQTSSSASQKTVQPSSSNKSPQASQKATSETSPKVSPSSSQKTSPIIGANRGSHPLPLPASQKVTPTTSPPESPSASQRTSPITIGANRTPSPPPVTVQATQRIEPIVTHNIKETETKHSVTTTTQARRPNMPSGVPRNFTTPKATAVNQSTTTKETRPRPYVEKEYATIYSHLENNWDWDKSKTISDDELHLQTIAKLKSKGMVKEGDGTELWLKNNHKITEMEMRKPKL